MKKHSGFKRVTAIVITLAVMLAGFSLATAASEGKIDGFTKERSLEDNYSLGQSGSIFYSGEDGDSHYSVTVLPGDEVRIPLTADMFTWSDARTPLPRQAVTLRELRQGRVTVRTLKQNNAGVLDYVQLETDMFAGKPFYAPNSTAKTGRTSYISVMFAEEVVSVEDLEFQFIIYIAVDGQTDETMKIVVDGTMLHDSLTATTETDYADIADGSVLIATDYVKSVDVNAGNGVTLDRTLLPDKKYYATCDIKPTTDPGFDKEYPEVYPTVTAVYKMNTVNMRYGRCRVTIDTKDDVDYYVYNQDMELIGRSKETLYYSDYYFLSTVEIPTFEKEEYLTNMSRGPSYEKPDYDSGELSEAEYLGVVDKAGTQKETKGTATGETTEKNLPTRWNANGADNSVNAIPTASRATGVLEK